MNDSRQTLLILRLVWAAMMAGLVGFMFVALTKSQDAEGGQPTLGYVAIGMIVMMTPVAFFIRNQVYKNGWQADVVKPASYFAGNLIFLSMFEGVAFFSLVATMQNGLGIAFAPAMIAMAMIVLNFPHGRPMIADHLKNRTEEV